MQSPTSKGVFRLTNLKVSILVFFSVSALWFVIRLAISQFEEIHTVGATDRLNSNHRSAIENVDLWMNREIQHARALAANPAINSAARELLETPRSPSELNTADAQKNLRDMLGWQVGLSEFEGYFIIDRDGFNIASSRTVNTGTQSHLSNISGFFENIWAGEAAFSGPVESDAPIQTLSGDLCDEHLNYFFGAPLHDTNGNVIAAFVIRINPKNSFYPMLAAHAFYQTGETYLVDRTGNLASPSRFDLINSLKGECQSLGNYFGKPVSPPTEEASKQLTVSAESSLKGYPGISFLPTPITGG